MLDDATRCPVSDWDPYEDAALLDPYPHYARLRDMGPVVHLSHYDLYALPRDSSVRFALDNWEIFSSAKGVLLNDRANEGASGTTLCSDPPEHTRMKDVIMRPLKPAALREHDSHIKGEARSLVASLLQRGTFDVVADLARHLPLAIVSRLVGLPEVGRQLMLDFAPASFNTAGPMEKERTRQAFEVLERTWPQIVPGAAADVQPGSWLAGLYEAADEGAIPRDKCATMVLDYVGPSLDTTITATVNAIWLFANHPGQWDLLRDRPNLIPNAINEIVRLESPIQGWTRYVTRDVDVEGVTIPAGSRVLVMFASANRDERRWDAPERFDIGRQGVAQHVGFGRSVHSCAGANLARMEIAALLTELLPAVKRFEIIEEEREVNNIVRLWKRLSVRAVQ
ncbi:Linalool 8-monooxygenase [Sphingomonas paucimobilis]|nr:Linalool 8-monooxygenase [Sphingomonas paucimobilis]